jgi:DNA-binding NtrC family response regulator
LADDFRVVARAALFELAMPLLLAIDDDPTVLRAFRSIFDRPDVRLVCASTGAEGLRLVDQSNPDAIILDLNLPDISGLDLFRRLREKDARIPVIFLTGVGTTETAIEAMKLGAFEYLLKDDLLEPAAIERLRELVQRAFEVSRLARTPAVVAAEENAADGRVDVLIGRCAGMQEVYKAIGRVASQDVTVLILGESGTGKELVARAVYQHSRRAGGPFLAINCAAIPENLLESELFGHEKGAFTGADRRRVGKFEQCDGGTLFLDEIGDMTPLTQTKVLRVLQDQSFERVGGNETIRTNVRVIAATNRDLETLTKSGQFRGDLYYRLGVFTIHLPPLRERGGDLPLLIDYYRRRYNRELERDVQRLAPEAAEVLARHPWPGNLRELQSVLKQALLQATGPVLLPEFLPSTVRSKPAEAADASAAGFDWKAFVETRLREGSQSIYGDALERMEREVITRVLQQVDGNQLQAARILGIARNSLRSKMKALGITIGRTVAGDAED